MKIPKIFIKIPRGDSGTREFREEKMDSCPVLGCRMVYLVPSIFEAFVVRKP